jgi:hypothetical protein
MDQPRPPRRSTPILSVASWLSRVTGWFTLQWHLHYWLGRRSSWCLHLVDRLDLEVEHLTADQAWQRAIAVDRYVLLWLVLEVGILTALGLSAPGPHWMALVPAISRIIDILRATLKVILLDRVSIRRHDRVASRERLVLIALLGYLELVLCFAIIYGAGLAHLHGAHKMTDALYFSVLTQITISFGTLTPDSWLKIVAAAQAFCGLYFTVVIIARTVGSQQDLTAIDDS